MSRLAYALCPCRSAACERIFSCVQKKSVDQHVSFSQDGHAIAPGIEVLARKEEVCVRGTQHFDGCLCPLSEEVEVKERGNSSCSAPNDFSNEMRQFFLNTVDN